MQPVRLAVPDPGRVPLDEADLLLLKGVADTSTVTGAAKLAGVSPAVAARRLSKLEHRLAATLLRGDAGWVRITSAGRLVLTAGATFAAAVAATAARVADRPGGIPLLRLAGFGGNWSGVVDDLCVRVPGMILELTSAEPADAAKRYDECAVDAIYAWQADGQPLVVARPAATLSVLEEPLWVALPVTHPAAHGGPIRLAALATDGWIVGPGEDLTHAVCTAEGFVPNVVAEVGSAASARSMVSHRVGVCLVSPLTQAPARDAGLVLAPLADGPRRRHVLLFDPVILDQRLAHRVTAGLRHCYAATANQRNPRYRHELVPHNEPPFDPSVLSGLRPAGAARRIRLEDLGVLRAVASAGSVNRAAKVLLISQPALSRRIRRLERALGIGLFVRTYRGTTLSPVAHQLLAEIAEAEAAFRAVLESVSEPPVRWRRIASSPR